MSETDEKINNAAEWLASQKGATPNVIHELRQRFEITAAQAAQACTAANTLRRGAGADA